ncbi:MAG: hypothetical protein KF833_07855 [Verrucomicrobiae bacterium]|nr:hypothetical protein [Verrucomicrobiae bacterium]
MSNAVQMVMFAGEPWWPRLQPLLHPLGAAESIQQVLVFAPDDSPRARQEVSRLCRFLSAQFPGLRVMAAPSNPGPEGFRADLESNPLDPGPSDPEPSAPSRVLNLTGAPAWATWAAAPWLDTPNARIIERDARGAWIAWHRSPEGALNATPLPEFPKTLTDTLAVEHLVRALDDDAAASHAVWTPAQPLPLIPLTAAAIEKRWDWSAAFNAAGLEPGRDNAGTLLGRFLGALLVHLGLPNVQRVTRPRRTAAPDDGREAHLWVHHAGRLVAIEARAPLPTDDASEDADNAFAAALLRIAGLRPALSPIPVDWVLVRPDRRLSPIHRELAGSLGIRVLDESDAPELPGRLAELFDLRLTPDAIEVERLLRASLAEGRNLRVFGAESSAVSTQLAAHSDPTVVRLEPWLDRFRMERRQNWLIWSLGDRAWLRVPHEGKSPSPDDWRLLLAALTGLPMERLLLHPDLAGPRAMVFEFPNAPEARQRVQDWLRPFLNTPLTFAAARDRLAVESRIREEFTPPAQRTAPRAPASPAPPAAQPSRSPTPPRPAAAPGRRRAPTVNPLADLDQALDAAFGDPPAKEG